MIVEDLIRTGRMLLDTMDALEVLKLISDVRMPETRNFFQHVFVVELPMGEHDGPPLALPMQVWGEEKTTTHGRRVATKFEPDWRKGLGAPFVFPRGGNPLNPQGFYGLPAFLAFDAHFLKFLKSPAEVEDFLRRRLERSPWTSIPQDTLIQASQSLHDRVLAAIDRDTKNLGLIVVAEVGGEGSPYEWSDRPGADERVRSIGESALFPGRFMRPRPDALLERFWQGKLWESKSEGRRKGVCTVCGVGPEVMSSYCKAWPWFLPEWTCPIPLSGSRKQLMEGVVLDEGCQRALTAGAGYFSKVTRHIHSEVTRELFSPLADQPAREQLRRQSARDLPSLYGAALLLPLKSTPDATAELAENLFSRLDENRTRRLQTHIDDVTGFESAIPESHDREQFRVTLVYFSGAPNRGDVHLRAMIQEVLPATLESLVRLLDKDLTQAARVLVRALFPGPHAKIEGLLARTKLLPSLLGRVYGGAYLWERLEEALRRRPLDAERPTRNTSQRLASLESGFPDNHYAMREEVYFYLAFLDFLRVYNKEIARGSQHIMPMRPWNQLLDVVFCQPLDQVELEGVAEMGFAAGGLIRQFSRQYWLATKVGAEGKDYLKHRVMTFGADLSPEAVAKRGLPSIFELERRLDKIHLSPDFKQRVGIILNLLERHSEAIRMQRHNFMAGFWSGYALQGWDRESEADDTAVREEETAHE